MSPKFSSKQTRPNVTGAIVTTPVRARTYEGHLGYERDAKSELFLLAVTNMVGEQTYYEASQERDDRFKMLCWAIATTDPAWLAAFIPYLRDTMQMRSAATVAAAHYIAAGAPNGRQLVDKTLVRADEPAELLAFYAQEYGKRFPQPLKRGVADAVNRLYTERNALKYDGSSKAWRMGDVIDLVHPKPLTSWQSELFRWLLDTRHNRDDVILPEGCQMIAARSLLEATPVELRRGMLSQPTLLATAGMTWESLAGWLQGPMDAKAWEAIIPSMGYMALLRNLRNFEQAGVDGAVLDRVATTLSDPLNVKTSRQFPLRFLSAYRNIQSERFSYPLERALEASLLNVPVLKGKTLILIDCSGSMHGPLSARSNLDRKDAAALFGLALGKQAEQANVYVYDTSFAAVPLSHPILRLVGDVRQWGGGGTNTWQAVDATFARHERIVILTDEQAHRGTVRDYGCPVYTFNLAGYRVAHAPSGTKGFYSFGGLTDAAFRTLALLDEQKDGDWPWEQS